MTPMEHIVKTIKNKIVAKGASLPITSCLLDAIDGQRQATQSSFIRVSCCVASQTIEGVASFSFEATVAINASLDDDASGISFASNYDAIWGAIKALACDGGESAFDATGVFSCRAATVTGGGEPSYANDGSGGTWAAEFSLQVDGGAP